MPLHRLVTVWALILETAFELMPSHAVAQPGTGQVPVSVQGALAATCHIETERARLLRGRSENTSSGVLYRGRYVITAAHNVHSDLFSRLRALRIACGRAEPAAADQITVDPSSVRVARKYTWRRFRRDVAIVRLPQVVEGPIVEVLGHRGAIPASPIAAVLAGFPGDDLGETANGWRLHAANTTVALSASTELVSYDVQTARGNSGGPLLAALPEGLTVLGIHVSGSEKTGTVRVFDAGMTAELDRMIAELPAEQ